VDFARFGGGQSRIDTGPPVGYWQADRLKICGIRITGTKQGPKGYRLADRMWKRQARMTKIKQGPNKLPLAPAGPT